MKTVTSFLVGLLFTTSLGAINTVVADDGILLKDEIIPGYCHMKFPAIREGTLGSDHPVLKDPRTGDMIDFYGPCDENPLGKGQIQQQKLEDLDQRSRP